MNGKSLIKRMAGFIRTQMSHALSLTVSQDVSGSSRSGPEISHLAAAEVLPVLEEVLSCLGHLVSCRTIKV